MLTLIPEFKGEYAFLSNFHPCNIVYRNTKFTSVEAAFQFAKVDENDPDYEALRNEFSKLGPAEAKAKGRTVRLQSDWNRIKIAIMYELCRYKFKENLELKIALMDTCNAFLIEGNWWHDNYWGQCLCATCQSDPRIRDSARNELGSILMRVRLEIIYEDMYGAR